MFLQDMNESRQSRQLPRTLLHVRDTREDGAREVTRPTRQRVQAQLHAAIQVSVHERRVQITDASVDCVVDVLSQGQHLWNETNNIL